MEEICLQELPPRRPFLRFHFNSVGESGGVGAFPGSRIAHTAAASFFFKLKVHMNSVPQTDGRPNALF